MIVGHREGEAVGQALPHSQALHRRQRVIQGIGIIARGIHGKSAVEPGRVCLRGETHHIMQIRVHRRRQRAADHRRILGDGSRGRSHGGRVIAAVDAHGHDRGGRAAVVVRHRNRKGIGQAFTRAQALHRGQRGIQRIGIVAVGIHAERAVAARRVAQWREADHIVHIRIRGRGQRAVGNGAAFGDVHGCGGQHGYVVGAVDGHGQGVGGSGAVVVGHRESEAVGKALPYSQALHRGQRIIQAIGIVAVGIQVERAVETRGIDLGGEGHCIMDIRVHRRGQYAADRWRILGDGSRGGGHCGRVIAAVDAHGHDCGRRAAVVVRHCNNECVGQAFASAQALYRGQ